MTMPNSAAKPSADTPFDERSSESTDTAIDASTASLHMVDVTHPRAIAEPVSDWLKTSRPHDTAELEGISQALEAELPFATEFELMTEAGQTELTPLEVDLELEGAAPHELRAELIEKLRVQPVDAVSLTALANVFESLGEVKRAHLMREVAQAVLGDDGSGAVEFQCVLTARERSGLRHPKFNGDAQALVKLAAPAMVQLFSNGKKRRMPIDDAAIAETERLERVVDAILSAIRALGGRAPAITFSESERLPISAGVGGTSEIVVGRSSLTAPLAASHLRFWAGLAMAAQTPELALMLTLSTDQWLDGISHVVDAMFGRGRSQDVQRIRNAVGLLSVDHLRSLASQIDLPREIPGVVAAARHSIHRAGLVVAGSTGAALSIVRARRGNSEEVAELVRFAASERHFLIRSTSISYDMYRRDATASY